MSLPPLNANLDLMTLAGFSSGAVFSHVLHVTMSDIFKGHAGAGGGIIAS